MHPMSIFFAALGIGQAASCSLAGALERRHDAGPPSLTTPSTQGAFTHTPRWF